MRLASIFLALACATPPTADAGLTDGAIALPTPIPPAPPDDAAPAAAPVWTCPDGWRAIDLAGGRACDPFPPGRAPCELPTYAHFVGAPACADVGAACPADGWPADLPTDRAVIYVRAGASGDGSRGAPYGTIADALAPGAVIAVAPGTYEAGPFLVPAGAELRGACASGVHITAPVPFPADRRPVIGLLDGSALRDVTVEGPSRAAITVADGCRASLSSIAVTRWQGVAIEVRPMAELAADRVLLETQEDGDAVGLLVFGAAVVDHLAIERAVGAGIVVFGDPARGDTPTLTLRDAAIDAVAPDSMALATGVSLLGSAQATIDRASIAGAYFGVDMDGASLTANDLVVRDIASPPYAGAGVRVVRGTAVVRRARIEETTGIGVTVSQGGSFTAEDLFLVGVRSWGGPFTYGLAVEVDSELALTRAVVAESALYAVRVEGTASLTDVRAEDNGPAVASSMADPGAVVVLGGSLTARRLELHRNVGIGLAVVDGASADCEDVIATEQRSVTDERDLRGGGVGIALARGARMTLARALLDQNEWVSFGIASGAVAVVSDLVVRDSRSLSPFGVYGDAIALQSTDERETSLRLTRARIERAHRGGVVLGGDRGRIEGADVEVLDTATAECGECDESGAGGSGIIALAGALTLARFHVSGSALAGLHVGAAHLVLSDGLIDHNRYAVAFTGEVDLSDVERTVVLRDNDRGYLGQTPYVLPPPTEIDAPP